MNKTKKNLVTWTIVLDFIAVASSLFMLIWTAVDPMRFYALMGIHLTEAEIKLIMVNDLWTYGLDLALNLSGAVCLLIYLKNYEKALNKAKKLFIAGLVLNVLSSPLSLASILLYIAHFKYIDIKVDKEEEVIVEDDEESLKRKIAKLRKLKEEGAITEEEFTDELSKLL